METREHDLSRRQVALASMTLHMPRIKPLGGGKVTGLFARKEKPVVAKARRSDDETPPWDELPISEPPPR